MEKGIRLFMHVLPQQDATLIILKGHLLIEEVLFDQAASVMRDLSELKHARLSFDQLAHVTKALFVHPDDCWLWKAIEKLNSLRNKLVHHLEPDRFQTLAEEFLGPSEDMMKRIGSGSSSGPLEPRLRSALAFMYGALSNLSKRQRHGAT